MLYLARQRVMSKGAWHFQFHFSSPEAFYNLDSDIKSVILTTRPCQSRSQCCFMKLCTFFAPAAANYLIAYLDYYRAQAKLTEISGSELTPRLVRFSGPKSSEFITRDVRHRRESERQTPLYEGRTEETHKHYHGVCLSDYLACAWHCLPVTSLVMTPCARIAVYICCSSRK